MHSGRALRAALLLLVAVACTRAADRENPQERAERLAQEIIIVDGHVDLPYRLSNRWDDVTVRTESGDFDYVRAREGGLDAPFMSVFTPANLEGTGRSRQVADSLIDMVESLARDAPDKFAIAVNPEDVEANFEAGRISLCLGMENGSPIENDLVNVAHFYNRGVRYITLAHSRDNHLSDSSYDTTGTWGGLSAFGRDVVREMNRLGIMVDVSHVTDNAFYDVMDVTRAPVIASHSSCRHFTPGYERNMGDEMIRRLAANGGVIMINFGSRFIREDARAYGETFKHAREHYLAEHGYERGSDEARAFRERFMRETPFPFADVVDVADHIDHVVELAGVDHVGFGSDFDGVGDTLPTGLKDASQYPNLIRELLARGYTRDDIEKIAYRNVFRVWKRVREVAERG